jgi:putative CocE/NonD family hydrolase
VSRRNTVKEPKEANIRITWGVEIPLRDGVHLNATLYLPRHQSEPAPCIVALTPYTADSAHNVGVHLASHGFPFAIVDVRGRGNSGGVFRPFIQEANDGYDVVEWLARQPYCDGQVGMRGGSYLGYVQWATAKEFPPHLATIIPAAAPRLAVDFPARNNIFQPYLVQWLAYTAGRAAQIQVFSDATFWSTVFRQWHESGRSFHEVDELAGFPSAIFQQWLAHPTPDEYWDACNPTADQYAGIQCPILTITGSYDDDQPGALEHYVKHLRNASASARGRHYLIVGPWDHAGTRIPSPEFGGVKFGPASLLDLPKLHLEWYAWTMQGGPKPGFLQKAVAYYVMGAERWRYADTLEAVTAYQEPYYLDSTTNATDVFTSGSLGAVSGQGPPDTYTYDPREASGPEVDAEARTTGGSLIDQGVTLALRGRQLVYHTAPFNENKEISGFFRFSAWIAIDCPDTDLFVSVHEIALDGSSIRLSTDAIRARYREGLRMERLINTTEPLCYEFERFTFVSREIRRGHRLRLIVAPIGRLIETTFSEKNYNGGGVVAQESEANAKPVTVQLFHDEDCPSALHIPWGRPEEGGTSGEPPCGASHYRNEHRTRC